MHDLRCNSTSSNGGRFSKSPGIKILFLIGGIYRVRNGRWIDSYSSLALQIANDHVLT